MPLLFKVVKQWGIEDAALLPFLAMLYSPLVQLFLFHFVDKLGRKPKIPLQYLRKDCKLIHIPKQTNKVL